MFDKPIALLTESQDSFLHWLEFYYNIDQIDKKDKPNKYIIEEDYLLDEWFKSFMFKREQEQRNPGKKRKKNYDDTVTFGGG